MCVLGSCMFAGGQGGGYSWFNIHASPIQAISRAEKLVAEQNDLIKRFRGMQGTSDMLEVNKLQRSYRRDQKKMEIQREEFFHKKLMEQVSRLSSPGFVYGTFPSRLFVLILFHGVGTEGQVS